MATMTRPPARNRTSVVQLFEIPLVVSAETVFDVARVAAHCAPVPGLAPVVGMLAKIYASVERISWNKARCRKLAYKAMSLVLVICDYFGDQSADSSQLQQGVERTVRVLHEIEIDAQKWAGLSYWKSWYFRNEVAAKIDEDEECLKDLSRFLSLAATLQDHDKVVAIQASLKDSHLAATDRRKAEEQLYRLRSARGSADLTPPELACECVRIGSQPEYSGPRNDIWKGRWLDRQDVALIFYKEVKMGARDENGIRILEVAYGLSYLHTQDIIHGSVKPSNILVQDDGRAIISDFSLTKLQVEEGKNSQTNPEISVFRYQAPEVILDNPISQASDVYSWAMTALEIITGCASARIHPPKTSLFTESSDPPYHSYSSPGILIALVITKNQNPIKSDYESPVLDKHPEIWELFVRCWNRNPTDRPTAKEIVEELEKISDES
ncbi:hypothetical protein FRC01_003307 [Tulasnella sp. 417]|nr:hypothetical protein FRC01_003307 [Tulasnella sp. 417]